VSVTPHGCISLLVIFGTVENFCTKSILFDVAEVSMVGLHVMEWVDLVWR
jgi:hypothetical protein